MNVICSVLLVIYVSGLDLRVAQDIEGVVKASSPTKYVVDFSEAIKKYDVVDPELYRLITIDKAYCSEKK